MYSNTEIFKEIPNTNGMYLAGSNGSIRSKKRGGKILKPYKDRYGYLRIDIFMAGKRKVFCVQQLMAMAWLGHTPCGHKIVVDHRNNVKTDNRLCNLQLISHRDNCSKDRKGYSSKHIGVSWNNNLKKWNARISIDGKLEHLGYFNNEEEAANYYQMALESIENRKQVKVKRPKFSSEYKGVSWDKSNKKWMASITIEGKSKYIGRFDDEYEAHLAYQKVLKNQSKL